MRSDARFDRAAGYKFTGTLTRPKLRVPDQNGRAAAFSPSSGSGLLRVVLGSSFLLSSQRVDALREYAVERSRLALRLDRFQLRRASFRFLLDELNYALAILIFIFFRIELALQHLYELRRHGQLFLRGRRTRGFR